MERNIWHGILIIEQNGPKHVYRVSTSRRWVARISLVVKQYLYAFEGSNAAFVRGINCLCGLDLVS